MWHLTIHRWTTQPSGVPPYLAEHLAWMQDQQLGGRVLAAGPSADGTLGIIVFGHMPLAEVVALCSCEPFVARGVRTFDVIPWDVHHAFGVGGFTIDALAHHRPDG